jgi:hypothetical protein
VAIYKSFYFEFFALLFFYEWSIVVLGVVILKTTYGFLETFPFDNSFGVHLRERGYKRPEKILVRPSHKSYTLYSRKYILQSIFTIFTTRTTNTDSRAIAITTKIKHVRKN